MKEINENGHDRNVSALQSTIESELQNIALLMQNSQYDEALTKLQSLAESGGDFQDRIQCQMGIVYAQMGNMLSAEQSFLRAVNLNSDLAQGFFNLGRLYQQRKNFESALAFYKEAAIIAGDDPEIYESMGECCEAKQSFRDAIAFYDASLKLRPGSLNAAARLAKIFVNERELDKAKEVLKLALVSHPAQPELHMILGTIHKNYGEYENAIAHFRKVVLHDEFNSAAFNELGECCEAIELLKQAEPFYAKAAKLDSMNHKAIANLGKLYYKKKNYKQTAVILQEWLNEKKRTAEIEGFRDSVQRSEIGILNILAEVNAKLGKIEKAIELWKSSLEIEPDQPEIKSLLEKHEMPVFNRISLVIED